MTASPRISSLLRHLAIAAAMAVAAGCASTPQASSPEGSTAAPAAAAPADSPAPVSQVAGTAKFATLAQEYGWHPEVRDGEVIYCREQIGNGGLSRIPEKTCASKTAVEADLLAEEHQREQMQKAAAAAGMNGH